MQRDKRGRFVKKALDGTQLLKDTITLRNGKTYKLKQGVQADLQQDAWLNQAMQNPDAYEQYLGTYYDVVPESPEVPQAPNQPVSNTRSLNTSIGFTSQFTTPSYKSYTPGQFEIKAPDISDPNGVSSQTRTLDAHNTLGLGETFAPEKINITFKDGVYKDSNGQIVSPFEIQANSHRYNVDYGYKIKSTLFGNDSQESVEVDDPSAGMNIFGNMKDKISQGVSNVLSKPIDKTKLANFLELARLGIGASVNNKIAERALEAEKPFLQDVSESHRSIYGDYRAQVQGEKAAAQLRNMASKPMTSDGALQQQMMMDAQIKGQEYIDQGNAQDEAMIKQTREVAWQQEKENQQQRQAVAMQNRQAMLMSQKNKANIENMRDSANFSQVIAPYFSGTEQRLRNEGIKQEKYQDYYDNALASQEVWSTYRDGLNANQKTLANEYATKGLDAVTSMLTTNPSLQGDWDSLMTIMKKETIRRQAALKGVQLSTAYLNSGTAASNQYGYFGQGVNLFPINKKGGTIYKAKLTKRTKDNDRGAKSIESSKKIAAKFLEKAIDSLYTYNDVELIAKPKKKKRKYQSGGGLPFVNFTPVFATSEVDEPITKSDTKDDLTSKDVLELLKDMDGLPSDMSLIVHSLKNFDLQDQLDPLGLSSSSDIASRYISLINKIKVAKFNREEYNSAFNQLKGNGGLNEFAITSEGMLVGTNKDGDFEYFTPDEVNAGEPRKQGYSLLTNSNLLYLRANSTDAAFNHQLTTFAQNGIGMEVITKQISDIIQGLGSSKESQEGFVQMGQNGAIKKGIEFLRKAAQEVGDDQINQNMSVADYYQAGYLTEDQATQAQIALQYIWGALPANAKSLLQVKGGSTKGAEALVKSLVFSKTSTETQFKATPKKMTKTDSDSSGSGDVEALKLSPVQMMQVGYTDHMPVTLQKGTKYAMMINAQVLPITDVNKKLLGVTTLDRVAESTFGGALDMNNVTMGSQLIDPHALQNVQIDSTNLYVMNLPIDKNSPDGTIKPDLAWMSKIEQIDKVIRDQGITDINQINKLYTDAGLPVLMDSNGQLNVQDYCKFGVLNGHALNTAFKDLDLLDNTILEIEDEDQINNVLSILNKGRSEKDRIDFDSKSWADSIFGTKHDSLFEGTIYIPVRTNAFTGMIGGGNYPDAETAAEVEALVQQKERTRGYVDPGLLM